MRGTLFTLALVVIILGFTYKMTQMGVARRDSKYNTDDTALLQELNRSLQRMEQRVEALETILLDQTQPLKTEREWAEERQQSGK